MNVPLCCTVLSHRLLNSRSNALSMSWCGEAACYGCCWCKQCGCLMLTCRAREKQQSAHFSTGHCWDWCWLGQLVDKQPRSCKLFCHLLSEVMGDVIILASRFPGSLSSIWSLSIELITTAKSSDYGGLCSQQTSKNRS